MQDRPDQPEQAASPLPARQPPFDEFRVVVLADLDAAEDPLLTARAAAMLPPTSRVAVHHGGRATEDQWLLDATAESGSNARYIWHGELNEHAGLELLASAHVVACTSITTCTAPQTISNALAIGVPVIATRIDSHIALLGSDHPGLFNVGDDLALTRLLDLAEISPPGGGRRR